MPTAPVRVRIGLLPIIDSVPFYAAEADGLFQKAGVDVQFITFASALERNAALQAGELDGQLADLIATGLINNDRLRVTIVKTTHRASAQMAMISLVAGKESGVTRPEDLRGRDIAISHNSLIEYHLDQYLDEAGVPRDAVKKVEVAQIPVRVAMLSQNQVAAAVLAEPATTLALQSGGRLLLSDRQNRLGVSVLEFRNEFLAAHPDTVRLVVAAHEEAVRRINADQTKYRHLLSEKANLPASLKETFAMPPFPEGDIPSPAEFQRAGEWMVQKGMLARAATYSDVVNGSFLPLRAR
ncbi:MAG: ABC transporter substrate-binding protein [Chloroflexi bacterium]|nr:ABC transporter substrate-binding protein [Chloroflexota bacterium]